MVVLLTDGRANVSLAKSNEDPEALAEGAPKLTKVHLIAIFTVLISSAHGQGTSHHYLYVRSPLCSYVVMCPPYNAVVGFSMDAVLVMRVCPSLWW